MNTTYEVNVTPAGFDGLTPVYDVLVYVTREAGICGPAEEGTVAGGLEMVDLWLAENGYARVAPFGEVCRNGFASAEVTR